MLKQFQPYSVVIEHLILGSAHHKYSFCHHITLLKWHYIPYAVTQIFVYIFTSHQITISMHYKFFFLKP